MNVEKVIKRNDGSSVKITARLDIYIAHINVL